MPDLSDKSSLILSTCHPDIVKIIRTVVRGHDLKVIYGHRTEQEQRALYAQGRTEPGKIVTHKDWPNSKHNTSPSIAIDILPYPFKERDWKALSRFYYLAGHMKMTAFLFDIPLIWGGDWNNNNDFEDEQFRDFMHFELANG
jgi:peptidoglycan L-alanyl-D-glutamate endopeptidase CwlK